jgi:hypothetical protein
MRTLNCLTLIATVAVLAACDNGRPQVDDGLKNDLALAAQMQPYNPQQFVSPEEAGYAAQQQQYGGYAPRTVQQAPQRPVVRQTSARRSTSSSSSGGYYPAPARQPEVKTNTKRDAIIGATAGAILGASTSRDKVKGGLIGAAAGGVLGAIIGSKVDVTKY